MVQINALCFSTICTPLPPIYKYQCLDELDLADNFTEMNDTIDMLIGSDFYWTLVTGKVLHTNGGPTAVSSKLGWLLSGLTEGDCTMVALNNLSICDGLQHPLVFTEKNALLSTLNNFWELEAIGIREFIPMNTEPSDESP